MTKPSSEFELSAPEPMLQSRELRSYIAMANESTGSSGKDLVQNSSLYREFQAEREEILKLKWLESEKAGHDIGFERALSDWILKHRAAWRRSRQLA